MAAYKEGQNNLVVLTSLDAAYFYEGGFIMDSGQSILKIISLSSKMVV
ncbi:hypothetical protein [Peribacillus simplex]|nr:hypothetical protein [Peribacillus simplex]